MFCFKIKLPKIAHQNTKKKIPSKDHPKIPNGQIFQLRPQCESVIFVCQDHAPELVQGIQLLWLRLDAPQGIAFARSLGGDAARGEALVTWLR